MARTQAADYDEKRDSITREAAALFGENGFSGASISDLAERCSVSKSLIYHYYDSKEAILFDVMNEHMDELVTVMDETSDLKGTEIEKLHFFTRELLQKYVGAASQQKVLLYDLAALPDNLRQEIVRKQRKIIGYVESLITTAGLVSRNNRKQLRAKIMLYFGMLNWSHSWYDPNGPVKRDKLAEMACNMLIDSFHD